MIQSYNVKVFKHIVNTSEVVLCTDHLAELAEKDVEITRLAGLLSEAEHFAIFILEECDEWRLAYDAAKSLIKKIGESHE
jgi:hypothetical protein